MKIKSFLSAVLCAAMLTGCTFGASVDTLLEPPKLSNEQSAIKEALISAVGKNIKLKYPKTGEYRSSFVIANIDNEDTPEAVVFYEKTGLNAEDGKARMAVLDQRDGKWTATYDRAGLGSEIDRIKIIRMGRDETPTIFVGYSVSGTSSKSLVGYKYADGVIGEIFNENCMSVAVSDIDGKGENEALIFTAGTDGVGTAKLYKKNDDGFELAGEVPIATSPAGDYAQIVSGFLSDGQNAVFVDTSNGDGTTVTQVLYCVDGMLRNPIYSLQNSTAAEMLTKTMRPSKYVSKDIDGDGVIEIPTLSVLTGYETAEKSEQVYLTDWNVFDTGKLSLTKKNSGYYSITDGYCFMLPSRWSGSVTVKENSATDEIIFYKYGGDINADMTELMRISVIKKGSEAEKLADGYVKITETAQNDYMVKVQSDTTEPLVLTMSEIQYNFKLT